MGLQGLEQLLLPGVQDLRRDPGESQPNAERRVKMWGWIWVPNSSWRGHP